MSIFRFAGRRTKRNRAITGEQNSVRHFYGQNARYFNLGERQKKIPWYISDDIRIFAMNTFTIMLCTKHVGSWRTAIYRVSYTAIHIWQAWNLTFRNVSSSLLISLSVGCICMYVHIYFFFSLFVWQKETHSYVQLLAGVIDIGTGCNFGMFSCVFACM